MTTIPELAKGGIVSGDMCSFPLVPAKENNAQPPTTPPTTRLTPFSVIPR